jgi:hypothetical protein
MTTESETLHRLKVVSEWALVKRINRALRPEWQQLKKVRGGRAWMDLGDFYILDVRHNFVVDHHVDIEELGRELEVLAPYERLA